MNRNRSAVAPETIVTAVAQNIISKRKNVVGHVPLSRDKKNPVDPIHVLYDVSEHQCKTECPEQNGRDSEVS